MTRKIFVALSTFGKHGDEPVKMLKESGLLYFINPLKRRLVQDEIIKMGEGCEGIIAGIEPYDDYVLDNMPDLRCISRCGVGMDNITLKKAKEKGIEILNTPGPVVQPVAELTIAMILDLLRRLSWQTALVKSGRWEKKTGELLAGKKIGLLGLGRIGKKVAEILVKLETKVYGTDLAPDEEWAKEIGLRLVSCEQLLRIADVLSIHLSFLEKNPFLLGEKEIRTMKRGSFLVNVARGMFVDEDALYAALKDGHLRGAALDTFSKEPYLGKLRELENVILTPHIGSLTKESRLEMEIQATKNLIDFLTK